ncbi:aminoglycoside phosphotransferase family protein [Pseudoclavibacter helvolus]|uniref:aminoglycoside phosphotransferase family protein n=1 Tax=Pseudoclavibacter helvolus TaxID=255205 RepID=UPI0024AE746D|nr:aminoglycoside phosphotransferase family protein [Pseudoclavibacter helvolus]
MTTDPHEPLLHAWRRNDWRFLTGALEPAHLGYIGNVSPEALAALRLLQPDARAVGSMGTADDGAFDLVFSASSSPLDIVRGFAALSENGALCIEVGGALAAGASAAPLRQTLRRAKRIPGAHALAYWSAPDLARTARLVPMHDAPALDATLARHDGSSRLRALSIGARLAGRMHAHWVFARQGYVVVTRSRTPHPIFGDEHPVIITPRFDTSRHVVALRETESGSGSWVAKVPRQPGDDSGIGREGRMLEALRVAAPELAASVPRVERFTMIGSTTYLLREAMHGAPLGPAAVARDHDLAVEIGLRFIDAMPRTRESSENSNWFDTLVTAPLERLSALSGRASITRLVERTHEALAGLRERPMPAVFEHGDLGHPNVLLAPSGELRVLDWERAREHGLPGHDLVFYLQYCAESARGAFTREAQRRAFDELWAVGGEGRRLLERQLGGHGLGFDAAFVLLAWTRSAATLADRLEANADSAGMADQLIAADRDVMLWSHALDWLGGTDHSS